MLEKGFFQQLGTGPDNGESEHGLTAKAFDYIARIRVLDAIEDNRLEKILRRPRRR